MRLTKSHFELIAGVIAALGADNISRRDHLVVAVRFADALARTTPDFDRDRFLRACEPVIAWRALALLQEELEAAGAPLARGARLPQIQTSTTPKE